jgi:hypothetical protein
MERFRLLAVGNSFSEDALYYLHDICAAAGVPCKVVNLYIGGCSLQRHYENLLSGEQVYEYQCNGCFDGQIVSLQQVLVEDTWDYILMQQASHDSGRWETYEPWLSQLAEELRQSCPDAELLLHKTWAYEQDSTHDAFERYHCSQQEMYDALSECYQKAALQIGVRLIPSADVIQAVRREIGFRYEQGEQSLCRDGFHMHMVYGRFLLGALFYVFLTGKNICENPFCPDGAEEDKIQTIRRNIASIFP